jgi:hypothetical protein
LEAKEDRANLQVEVDRLPFTLSHAVAAAPFARYGFVLSALVIGSFSPDFIYFIRLTPIGHFAHTVPGVFLFCLPCGMAVLWIYHRLLKEPLAALLPDPLRNSLLDSNQPFSFMPFQRLAALAISMSLGAFTHLAWDSFTHESGAALRFFPFLGMSVIDLGFYEVPLTRVLHHSSSLVGLAWIALETRRWVTRARAESNGCGLGSGALLRSACAFSLLFSVSAILGMLYAWGQASPLNDFLELRRMMVQATVATGSFLGGLLAAYGILWHLACSK